MSKESKENSNADGGYTGFHHMHKGGLNAHADPIPWKKSPDSGPHTLGHDEGKKMDKGIKDYPNVKPIGS